jgi:PAS domain S-box-containing protein
MRHLFEVSGEVGHDLAAVDWTATPLGSPDDWPASLRTPVRILLTSRFSMWMAWGPELTFFCNDTYRQDTLGGKYPWALGQPASEVWSEIWPDIGPRIERVMSTGEATWDESLQLFLDRHGYLEETYHTFSYSPLADDDGRTAGMLCVVSEDTQQVLANRRMGTLRDLGNRSAELDERETLASAEQHLAGNPYCLPFTLTYLFDRTGSTATLAAATGFDPHVAHPAAPASISQGDPDVPWPVAALAHGESVIVDELGDRFSDLPCGAWDEPPTSAMLVPLVQPRSGSPYGFLVVGLNRYRALDEEYRGFVDLVAGHLAGSITSARAFEFEKQRAESLAEIDRAKTDFFTNVSHEFRTPLTLLLGPAEDALTDPQEPLPPAQHARVEVVHRNGLRLLKLVNSLLDFSRLESGRIVSRFEPVDLGRVTSELAAMFDSAVERTGLTLTVDCPPLDAPVHVDLEQWAKIVLNLLSNALKFTFDGGITVALRRDGDSAVLTVSDTGAGIPEEELPHLFERFHRVQGARSRTFEGSGIGLALVSELVAVHGGQVGVESELGRGSTFTVSLPVGTDHLPADQVLAGSGAADDVPEVASGFVAEALRWLGDRAAPPAAAEPEPIRGDIDRARVLVVDDNVDMREYVSGLLAPAYDVTTATDGLDALDQVSRVRPDLVITDVMMPGLDGFGLLEKLQADPATVGVPVIMLSARAGDDGTVEGLEAGADDYLVKPFSARELLARVRVNLELDRVRRVRGTLERSQAMLDQAQRMAGVGSWEVDLLHGTVTASAEMLRLVGMEREEFEALGFPGVLDTLIHPDDRERVEAAIAVALENGASMAYESRLSTPAGERLVRVRGEVVRDGAGEPRFIRGSLQDVTEQRQAEQALATAAANQEAALREHAIADELQRSLLPERSFDLEHLDLATYYRAGVEGTQVGGDWYDVIDLGAGRTAMVVGDVMGRGVSAASSMGQLRSAVRAFTKLDIPPSEVLEYLDGIVQDLTGDQIVTCVYAVFDSTDQTMRFANAGHLPPLLVDPGGPVHQLGTAGPPLGAGYFGQSSETVQLRRGSTVAFYTDGLVEQRGRDLDVGIEQLADQLCRHADTDVAELPQLFLDALLPDGPDDDVAVLVARVNADPFEAAVSQHLGAQGPAVSRARRFVGDQLREWQVPEEVVDELVLITSELVTNAFLHGRPPVDLRLRRSGTEVVLEVQDRAALRPRRRLADDDDEHGRGMLIVSTLADAWGTRSIGTGKSVWCTRNVASAAVGV